MTITAAATSAAVYGTTSCAPTVPTGVGMGDLLVMPVGAKPITANGNSWVAPSGWRIGFQRGNAGGYGTTLAADTGNTSVALFVRVADGSESDGDPVTVTPGGSGSDACWGLMRRFTKTKGVWDWAGTSGTDTSAGNLSITMDADPGIVAGDYLTAAFCDPTNAQNGANLSAAAMTCTGVTLGTVTEVAEPCSSLGNNVAGLVLGAPVNAGNSAGNLLTATATAVTGTNVKGPMALLRIRENVAPVGLHPFNGLSHHDEPNDELYGRRAVRRPSGLLVPRRRLAVAAA